ANRATTAESGTHFDSTQSPNPCQVFPRPLEIKLETVMLWGAIVVGERSRQCSSVVFLHKTLKEERI
ncbi:MAG: hypothetical protein E7K46_07090, partial [Corynebacterium sp.]|nr:hypothetical protein [Corynebacterium sp.]